MSELMSKLMIWIVAFCVPLALGAYLGYRHQQGKVEVLEQKLADYKELGKTIQDLKAGVEEQLSAKNQLISNAYDQELKGILARFSTAADIVNNESANMRKRAVSADAERKKIIGAIQSLPACSAEQQAQIQALINNVSNPTVNQALCSAMPLPAASLRGLRMAYQLEAAK